MSTTSASTSFTLQISNVHPGVLGGGAIFNGIQVGARSLVYCKASSSSLFRLPESGEFWYVEGYWETYKSSHSGVRSQLVVTKSQIVNLPLASYVSSLLSKHPAFRGFYFGPKKINKLMDSIGGEALVQLLNDGNYLHLSDVIHEDIAKRLVRVWQSLKNEIETINFLVDHNFDPPLAKKVIKLSKRNTVARLKDNPYSLVCFYSISKNLWQTIEKCAKKMSIDLEDSRRLKAAIEFVLYKKLQEGHTALPYNDTIKEATKLLRTDIRAKKGVEHALRTKTICTLRRPNTDEVLLQLVGVAYIEIMLRRRINRLLNLNTDITQQDLFSSSQFLIQDYLTKYNKELNDTAGYSLTSEQCSAVSTALSNHCSIITGYGGTGKTTVLRAVANVAQSLSRVVYGVTLSGKAKVRLAEAADIDAMTIHAFLSDKTDIDIDCNPVLIVDEASMVDIALFNKLLASFDGRRLTLVLVGDPAQISPVGFGLFFHKLVHSNVPIAHLTKVHRQALESPLHRASMLIREGISPPIQNWSGEKKGLFLVECKNDREELHKALLNTKQKLSNLQIISPHSTERMVDSGTSINNYIQRQFNSITEDFDKVPGFKVGKTWLKEGDPVIVTQNNYEYGLFNGNTGRLTAIETSDEKRVGIFHFDGENTARAMTIDTLIDLGMQLSYCISIHKSQGSEFEAVAIACISDSKMLERSLIYTAITRSKELCLIVGSKEVFERSILKPSRSETLHVGFE
ncbi:AAA family ATPase [Vibrio campbellii]|uniref:AAA family ATPase n=1 Tax=Vibrio campbellii TaxID=680 RepID=UPI001F437CC0|nr:AAA family ATPase [Vibrio campbellii]MCE7729350.1 ATP-dependent RecD-like DNA helicase [Vibrio campbellii]